MHYQMTHHPDGWVCPMVIDLSIDFLIYWFLPAPRKIPENSPSEVHQRLRDSRRLVAMRSLLSGSSSSKCAPPNSCHFQPVPRSRKIVHHESLNYGQKLGKGAFGEVYKAKFMRKDGSADGMEVAVKQIIGAANKNLIQDFCQVNVQSFSIFQKKVKFRTRCGRVAVFRIFYFLQEAYIMSLLSHRNVIGLFGIATLKMPIVLIMELVPGGDLKVKLMKSISINNLKILKIEKNQYESIIDFSEKFGIKKKSIIDFSGNLKISKKKYQLNIDF